MHDRIGYKCDIIQEYVDVAWERITALRDLRSYQAERRVLMRIVQTYSHLNGLEFLQVHQPGIWAELRSVVEGVHGESCKTKVGKEKTNSGNLLYSPKDIDRGIQEGLKKRQWEEGDARYKLIREAPALPPKQKREEIQKAGPEPILSYNQTNFVKSRVAVEVQFGKYAFVAYDLFVKHLAFYIGDVIDVGVEVLPMKELQGQMSSGPAYYEGPALQSHSRGPRSPGRSAGSRWNRYLIRTNCLY